MKAKQGVSLREDELERSEKSTDTGIGVELVSIRKKVQSLRLYGIVCTKRIWPHARLVPSSPTKRKVDIII